MRASEEMRGKHISQILKGAVNIDKTINMTQP